MKTMIHKANQRGAYKNSWLDSKFSFSFADYYDPQRMGHGFLRVLNDDKIAPTSGFGTHGHRDMEIVSVVLGGELEHKDSMGNTGILRPGDIQLMSAGSGVMHSEWNPSGESVAELLQLWIMPNRTSGEPSYASLSYSEKDIEQKWLKIVSPKGEANSLSIKQESNIYLANFKETTSFELPKAYPKEEAYLFVIEGELEFEQTKLERRDALYVFAEATPRLKVTKSAKLLLVSSKA